MNDLKAEIRGYATLIGTTLVGFTSVERLKEAPKRHKPENILPNVKTVVVFAMLITPQYGKRVLLGIIVTNLLIEPDSLLDESVRKNLCPPDCNACIDSFPIGAIETNKEVNQIGMNDLG